MGTIQITGKAARKVECDVLEYTLIFTRTKGSVSLAIEAVEKDMEKNTGSFKEFWCCNRTYSCGKRFC
mgnify:CR=1 FL=1